MMPEPQDRDPPSLPREALDRARREVVRLRRRAIGDLAVGQGFLSSSQLEESLRLLPSDGTVALESLLVARNLISAEQLVELTREFRRRELAPFRTAPGTPVPPEVAEAQADPDRLFDQYVRIREIGRGGAGKVWKAWDRELSRWVALKILRDDAPDLVRRRFFLEAQAAARIRHPAVVTVHDSGEHRGRPFLVMELIEGQPLDPRRPLSETLPILRKVACGLEEAHRHNVIHRDLKPANIMVDEHGEPHVVDFGLAHLEDSLHPITRSGSTAGTPQYMAPEQVSARPGEIGPRTDVYALGAILYELVSGHSPYDGKTAADVYEKIRRGDASPLHGSKDLVLLCKKAMERDPARRYASAGALAEDLRRYLDGEPILARSSSLTYLLRKKLSKRRNLVAAVVAIAVLPVVAAWGLSEWNAKERLERRRLLYEQKIRPLENRIQETRSSFYIRGLPIDRRLQEVERAIVELRTLARDPENAGEAELWILMGMGWYFVGDDRQAEEALRKAVGLSSADPRAHFFLGRIYLERSILSLLDETTESLEARGLISPEWSEPAQHHLQKAGTGWGGASEIDLHVSRLYRPLAENRRDEALRLCDEGLAKFGEAPGTEEYWNVRGCLDYIEAILAFHRGSPDRESARLKFEQAFACFSRALVVRPHYAWGYLMRGRTREYLRQREAIEDYDEAVRIQPRAFFPRFFRGTVRQNLREWDAALENYDAALRLDPEHARSWHKRGIVWGEKGNLDRAITDYSEAIRLRPGFTRAYNNRGICWRSKGDPDRATADFTRALEIDPQYSLAYLNRGEVRKERQDLPGARADFEKALEVSPPDWAHRKTVEAELLRLKERP